MIQTHLKEMFSIVSVASIIGNHGLSLTLDLHSNAGRGNREVFAPLQTSRGSVLRRQLSRGH
jgi:hypothetical protein